MSKERRLSDVIHEMSFNDIDAAYARIIARGTLVDFPFGAAAIKAFHEATSKGYDELQGMRSVVLGAEAEGRTDLKGQGLSIYQVGCGIDLAVLILTELGVE
jgi:hypothetical protein